MPHNSHNLTPPKESSAEEWFNGLQPTPPPRKKSPLRAIIFTVVIVFALATSALVMFVPPRHDVTVTDKDETCFELSAYDGLLTLLKPYSGLDTNTGEITIDEDIYAHEIFFVVNTTAFNLDLADDPTEFLQALGTYYKGHHKAAPLRVQIDARAEGSDTRITNEQIDIIEKLLIEAGLDTAALSRNVQAALVQNGTASEDVEIEEDSAERSAVSVRIIPTATNVCSQ